MSSNSSYLWAAAHLRCTWRERQSWGMGHTDAERSRWQAEPGRGVYSVCMKAVQPEWVSGSELKREVNVFVRGGWF